MLKFDKIGLNRFLICVFCPQLPAGPAAAEGNEETGSDGGHPGLPRLLQPGGRQHAKHHRLAHRHPDFHPDRAPPASASSSTTRQPGHSGTSLPAPSCRAETQSQGGAPSGAPSPWIWRRRRRRRDFQETRAHRRLGGDGGEERDGQGRRRGSGELLLPGQPSFPQDV